MGQACRRRSPGATTHAAPWRPPRRHKQAEEALARQVQSERRVMSRLTDVEDLLALTEFEPLVQRHGARSWFTG